jgi:hypothetical protein
MPDDKLVLVLVALGTAIAFAVVAIVFVRGGT